MPLLNAHAAAASSDFALSLHDQAEDTPEASPSPNPSSPVKAVLASTRANWPLVLFHLLILAGAIGYAATATAQPVEALGVSSETIQAVAGDPWATVVALLFVGGQLVAAWRDWSKVRGTDLEKARERIELLEQDALEKAKVTLCEQLLKKEAQLWVFLKVEGLSPDNNLAERLLRQGVLWRKGSFGTDSGGGSRIVERTLTVIETLRLQKRPLLDWLRAAFQAHVLGLQPTPVRGAERSQHITPNQCMKTDTLLNGTSTPFIALLHLLNISSLEP